MVHQLKQFHEVFRFMIALSIVYFRSIRLVCNCVYMHGHIINIIIYAAFYFGLILVLVAWLTVVPIALPLSIILWCRSSAECESSHGK